MRSRTFFKYFSPTTTLVVHSTMYNEHDISLILCEDFYGHFRWDPNQLKQKRLGIR